MGAPTRKPETKSSRGPRQEAVDVPPLAPLRALTLYASWAHAVAHYGKTVENRTWKPYDWMIGQQLVIHAGKKLDPAGLKRIQEISGTFVHPDEVPRGAFVAIATVAGWCSPLPDPPQSIYQVNSPPELSEVRRELLSPWFTGPYGIVLRDVRALRRPVPALGHQGLWILTPREKEAVLAEDPQR